MLRNKNRANQSEIPEENRDPEMSDSESNEAAVEEPKASYVNVRSFKGKTYVDIREYYEKDGKLLPGKKGVALNTEQYEALKGLLETIDEQVASA
ncbi:Activated RNA polymerase II transcriptional coactivator p15-like protein [Aphelenchoides fujianensis]|nr:Activated RNA polymerase II transcriptional coactivator p15-like protein [Aphelenchoides fujianensis]